MSLKKQFAFLAPVEVVKVTSHNLQEVAEWCGGKVAQTESRRVPGRMDSYVWVPTPKGTAISWAFPGMYITKRVVVTLKDELKCTYSVFRRDYFEKNYFETPDESIDATWGRKDGKKASPKKPKAEKPKGDTVVNVNVDPKVVSAINEIKQDIRELAVKAGIEVDEGELEVSATAAQAIINTFGEGTKVEAVELPDGSWVDKNDGATVPAPVETQDESIEAQIRREHERDTDFDPRKVHPNVLQKAKELVEAGFAAEEEVVQMLSTDIDGAWEMLQQEKAAEAQKETDVKTENLGGLDDGVIRG